MTEQAPQFVLDLAAATERLRLIGVRCHDFLPEPTSPVVISVVKDEILRIRDFFRHYTEIGIKKFVIADNGSTDGTFEYLLAREDVDLYLLDEKFSWQVKHVAFNRLTDIYGRDRWYLLADADEQMVFEQCGYKTVEDLVRILEPRGITRVRGMLIDMYSDRPLHVPEGDAVGTLCRRYPFFDADTYQERATPRAIGVNGGPRLRIFGGRSADFRPLLTKYPLFKMAKGDVLVNPHFSWPYQANFVSPRHLGLLHFKFLDDFHQKVSTAVAEKCFWNDSLEYRMYAETLAKTPDATFMVSSTRRYEGPDDLIAVGLIEAVGWS